MTNVRQFSILGSQHPQGRLDTAAQHVFAVGSPKVM
jgi:hypothetical protein